MIMGMRKFINWLAYIAMALCIGACAPVYYQDGSYGTYYYQVPQVYVAPIPQYYYPYPLHDYSYRYGYYGWHRQHYGW